MSTIAFASGSPQTAIDESRRASYLVVGPVDALVIYDAYERRLSPSEQSRFHRFTPMRVVARTSLMGDRYSRSMMVDVEGVRYAIQVDENGQIVLSRRERSSELFENVIRQEDSVRVIAKGGIRLLSPDGIGMRLEFGAIVKRYFTSGQRSYVGTLENPRIFGWIAQRRGYVEEVDRKEAGAGATATREEVRQRIERRIGEVNGFLRHLYGSYGTKTGRAIPPPEWQIRADGANIVCALEKSPYEGAHEESARMLASEFRGFAIGSNAEVTARPGIIEVRFNE